MIRYIRWQIILVVLGMILAAVLLSYQAVGLEEVFVPASGGVLIEGVAGWPQTLNPLLSFTNPVDRDICALVFEGLTRYDRNGQLTPALATGWNVSLDGLVYTFWLRQDVRWQDGITFSADDVVFTTQLLQDAGYTGPADLGALWRSVQVDKINRWTVTFTLQEPYAPFLDYTTIGLLPMHLLEGVTAAELPSHPFNRQPIGTGRFQIAGSGWEDGKLLMNANLLYREQRPQLAGIEFRFFADHASALAAFEPGEVHTVSDIQRADIGRAQALQEVNLFTSSLPRYTTILLNLQDEDLPFFQDRSVRQALLHALDRPELIANALNGQGIIAHSPISPDSWAFFGDVSQYGYDPDQAAALLDAAGWSLPPQEATEANLVESEDLPDGVRKQEERELSFTLTAAAGVHEQVAREVARQWAKLGIRATVIVTEPLQIQQILTDRSFDAIIADIDMRGDPDLYALWSESAIREGQNYAGWRNREASELLEKARQSANPGQRATLYYHFQQLFAQEAPAILLYYHTYTYGVSSQVQQVSIGPLTDPSDRFITASDWFLVWREVTIRKTKRQP